MEQVKKYTFNALLCKEDDMYVVECVEFGTVSQGSTIEEAIENIKEATELYIDDMSEEDILKKCNTQIIFSPIHLETSRFNVT